MNVVNRGSKSTGKIISIMNASIEEADPFWLDFVDEVTKWKNDDIIDSIGNAEDEVVPDVYFSMIPENEAIQAKKNELESWKYDQVYTEVSDAV